MEAVEQEDISVLPGLDDTDRPENARRMLRAGLQLFARKGYKGTSVREIVQAAQVTNPMLYYYFDDKEGLFRELIDYMFETLAQDIAVRMAESSSLNEMVEAFIAGYFKACRRSPIAVKFFYTVIFGPTEGTPRFDIFEEREQIIEGIAAQLQRAADEGAGLPSGGFSAEFLTEQLLGLVSNHLMRGLKEAEQAEDFEAHLRGFLSEEAAEDLSNFFFYGATFDGS